MLCGLGGNDTLVARGSDTLVGGPGNDILQARNGLPDFLVGGPGRDRATIDPSGIDTLVGVERAGSGSARQLTHNPSQSTLPIYSKGWYQHPWVGRLYFTGGQGFCSGALVAPNIVLTAGHCLYSSAAAGGICLVGAGGTYIANFGAQGVTFVPGQWGQQAPYGNFTSRDAVVALPWAQAYDNCAVPQPRNVEPNSYYAAYDYGFVILNPNSAGQQAGNVTGGWFTIAAEYQGFWYWSLGYPGDGWFANASGGNYPYYCYSKHTDTSKATAANGAVGWELGIGCLSTGGSSGGPWIVDANNDGRWTEIAGVNSHGPASSTGLGINMWSPYFSRAVIDLFNYARTL